MVIEKIIQAKSRGKKILGFGKNDLNMMCYISMLPVNLSNFCLSRVQIPSLLWAMNKLPQRWGLQE